MRSRLLESFLALAAVGAALAVAAAPAGARTGEATASAATCKASNLVVWLPNGMGSGAAGSVFYKLRISNGGSAACSLKGFPAVRAVNLKGQPIGEPATHEAGQKPRRSPSRRAARRASSCGSSTPATSPPPTATRPTPPACGSRLRERAARKSSRCRSGPAPNRPSRCSASAR